VSSILSLASGKLRWPGTMPTQESDVARAGRVSWMSGSIIDSTSSPSSSRQRSIETCFLLGRPEQFRTEPTVAWRLVHPELAHLTGTAPGVPADPRHDAAAFAHKEREQFAVGDTGGARIELGDPIFQVLHVVWSRVDGNQRNFTHSLPINGCRSAVIRRELNSLLSGRAVALTCATDLASQGGRE